MNWPWCAAGWSGLCRYTPRHECIRPLRTLVGNVILMLKASVEIVSKQSLIRTEWLVADVQMTSQQPNSLHFKIIPRVTGIEWYDFTLFNATPMFIIQISSNEYYQRLKSHPWSFVLLTFVIERICGTVNVLVSGVMIYWWWRAHIAANIYLIKPYQTFPCHDMSLIWFYKDINNWCHETWGNCRYKILQIDNYFEATQFCFVMWSAFYQKCAAYAACSWCKNYARFWHWPS